jgi:flotillin
MPALGIIAIILVVAVLAIIGIITKLLQICAPNEVLVISGKHRTIEHKTRGSRKVGYRLVQGGRTIRIPMMEKVDKLDLTNMIVDIKVAGAYSKGGIPLNVEGVANVKIASVEPTIGNAIERFLRKPRAQIMTVCRETLEGNLRGVLATLTPEEVNQDREKFAASLLHEADVDLSKLGISLDTLKIQNVSDDKGYLDSIGRTQSAALQMRSRIAEAENNATEAERSAENLETKELAKIEADISEARAEARRRIIDAQTRKDAMVAEERADVYARVAKANAELKWQQARVEQVRLQLLADQIKPAEANLQKMVETARGAASSIIEDGKATAGALRAISETWQRAGDNARQIFVAQKLTGLVTHLMSTVDNINVDKVTFIDNELTKGGGNFAVNAAVTSEQLKHTLGVDVPALLERIGGKPGGGEWLASSALEDVE